LFFAKWIRHATAVYQQLEKAWTVHFFGNSWLLTPPQPKHVGSLVKYIVAKLLCQLTNIAAMLLRPKAINELVAAANAGAPKRFAQTLSNRFIIL